jgi:hypothetical protein
METLKGLLDALRASVYNMAALMLPGAFLVEIVRRSFGIGELVPWHPPVPYLIAAYVAGFTLQGISGMVFHWAPVRRATADDAQTAARAAASATAAALLVKRYDVASIPPGSLVDVALTRAADQREVYDKFTALRDMSRALALAFALTALGAGVRLATLGETAGPLQVRGCIAGLVVGLVGFFGSVDRYRRFAELPEKAILSVLIALELKERAASRPEAGQTGE